MVEENKRTPYISIAIASYNYGHCLRKGIKAIAGQSFKDIEVVYLDDASTDDSVKIIRDIMKEYPDIDIRLIENENNMGLLYSKTRLMYECRGTYIMLCDADDWMGEGCLEKLAQAARAENADRVVSEVINIDENGKTIQVQALPVQPSKWLWNIHHGCLYRRSIIVDNNIRIEYEPDDVYFITKYNQFCNKTAWVHEPLYYWYVHTDSSGRATRALSIETMSKNFRLAAEYIQETQSFMEGRNGSEAAVEDAAYLEMLAMKVYYLQLFHSMRYYNIKKKMQGYKCLRNIMKQAFPEYLHNKYIIRSKKNVRPYAYYIIVISMWLEKLHLMKPAFIGYHILSKFIYFDQ